MSRIATPLRIFASVLVLAASPAVTQAPPASPEEDEIAAYRIGPRDVVRIEVFEEADLNREVPVNDDGTIRLPLVGNVQAEGLTEEGLAARLKAILEENFLQRASVSVEVVKYLSRPISVLGAVRKPGSLDYSGRVSLLEVLTAAGGLSEAHGNTIHILRRASNGLTDQVTIPVEELLVRADADVNLPIFANDLITVPAAEEVTVYLLGEVGGAGAITFRRGERITLLAAIARAGGLTERASNKIRIQRRRAGGETEEIVVRYKRVLAGEEPDPELRAGDLIIVKESFF